MPRVVPSQVVTVIDRIFRGAAQPNREKLRWELDVSQSESLAVIVELVEQIPSELITLEGDEYAAFAASLRALKHALDLWPTAPARRVSSTPGFPKTPTILLLRDSLAKCADEAAVKGTPQLTFIEDGVLRESLRLDVSTAHSAMINGEWKPATVIAGSVVESLLLWALLEKDKGDIMQAVDALVKAGTVDKRTRNQDLVDWGLHQFIEVARHLNVIKEATAEQCRIARGFRNLIHPGKVERTNTRCSRGTGHSAIAAMERMIEELQ
jgi:hypothetical protein